MIPNPARMASMLLLLFIVLHVILSCFAVLGPLAVVEILFVGKCNTGSIIVVVVFVKIGVVSVANVGVSF